MTWWQLLPPALALASLLFGALFGAIVVWLRGSSRGHRILVESAIVLALGLPVAGVQMASDLNRGLDGSAPVVVSRLVEHTERRVHRGRRGRRSYSYHLRLAAPGSGDGLAIPNDVQVAADLFRRAAPGHMAELHVSKGWLDVPWYRHIDVRAP